MAGQQNTDRILTTHVGSLPRPHDVLDLMQARLHGEAVDGARYDAVVKDAVRDCVHRQARIGIDVVADGEISKRGFFTYISERLAGFEARPELARSLFPAEEAAFPEYYAQYFKQAMTGGVVAPLVPLACVGPVSYTGHGQLATDLANLKAALVGLGVTDAFVPAVAPSGVGRNLHYRTEEEYIFAVGEALRTEYLAIVDAGFLLQVDDPFLTDVFAEPGLDETGKHKRASMFVEAINTAIRGIPAERVRLHTCYGINEGPRIHEAALAEVAPYMMKINAGAYSFEAANPRHEHEYHLWEHVKLPDGKVIVPGVITHASNIVEHPEFICERLVRFAERVGRENVIAGADCGFSSQATFNTEVHPTVVWAKFEALVEGARLASAQLWSRA